MLNKRRNNYHNASKWGHKHTLIVALGIFLLGASLARNIGSIFQGEDQQTVSAQTQACGDGVIGGSEQCDDGNIGDFDGCNNECQIEPFVCSSVSATPTIGYANYTTFSYIINGSQRATGVYFDYGDGNTGTDNNHVYENAGNFPITAYLTNPNNLNETIQCSTIKRVGVLETVCGDGIIEESGGEQCEDGDMDDGDGCNSACQLEPFSCDRLTINTQTGYAPQEIVVDIIDGIYTGGLKLNQIFRGQGDIGGLSGNNSHIYNTAGNYNILVNIGTFGNPSFCELPVEISSPLYCGNETTENYYTGDSIESRSTVDIYAVTGGQTTYNGTTGAFVTLNASITGPHTANEYSWEIQNPFPGVEGIIIGSTENNEVTIFYSGAGLRNGLIGATITTAGGYEITTEALVISDRDKLGGLRVYYSSPQVTINGTNVTYDNHVLHILGGIGQGFETNTTVAIATGDLVYDRDNDGMQNLIRSTTMGSYTHNYYINQDHAITNIKYSDVFYGIDKISRSSQDQLFITNGYIFEEQCDDGDTDDGDGCSQTCQLEPLTCTLSIENNTGYADRTEFTYDVQTLDRGTGIYFDYGDETTGEVNNHTYNATGTYPVTAYVTHLYDPSETITCTNEVIIEEQDEPGQCQIIIEPGFRIDSYTMGGDSGIIETLTLTSTSIGVNTLSDYQRSITSSATAFEQGSTQGNESSYIIFNPDISGQGTDTIEIDFSDYPDPDLRPWVWIELTTTDDRGNQATAKSLLHRWHGSDDFPTEQYTVFGDTITDYLIVGSEINIQGTVNASIAFNGITTNVNNFMIMDDLGFPTPSQTVIDRENDSNIDEPFTYTEPYTRSHTYNSGSHILVLETRGGGLEDPIAQRHYAVECTECPTDSVTSEDLVIDVYKGLQSESSTFPGGIVPYYVNATNESTQATLENITIIDIISDNAIIESYSLENGGIVSVNSGVFVIDEMQGSPISLAPGENIEMVIYAGINEGTGATNYIFAAGNWVPDEGVEICLLDDGDAQNQCARTNEGPNNVPTSRSNYDLVEDLIINSNFQVCADNDQGASTETATCDTEEGGCAIEPDISLTKTLVDGQGSEIETMTVGEEATFIINITGVNIYRELINRSEFSLTDYLSGDVSGIGGLNISNITLDGNQVDYETGNNEYTIDLSNIYQANEYVPVCKTFEREPIDHNNEWSAYDFESTSTIGPNTEYTLPDEATNSGYDTITRYEIQDDGELPGFRYYPGQNDQWFNGTAIRTYFNDYPHTVRVCQSEFQGNSINEFSDVTLEVTATITDASYVDEDLVCNEAHLRYMTSQTGRDLTDDVCFDVQCSGGSTPIDGECVEDTLSCSITVIPQGGTGGTLFEYTIQTEQTNLDNSYIEYGDGMTGEGLTGEHTYNNAGDFPVTGYIEKNGEIASCELDTSILVCGDGEQYCSETGLCIPEGEDCGNLSCTITVGPQGGTGGTTFYYTLRNNRVDIDELDSYYIEYGDGSSGTDLIYTYGNTTGDIFATGHVAIAGFDASCELDTSILVCGEGQQYCSEEEVCIDDTETCSDLSCNITVIPQGGTGGTVFNYTIDTNRANLDNSYIEYGDGMTGSIVYTNTSTGAYGSTTHSYNSTGFFPVTGHVEKNRITASCELDTSILVCGEGQQYCSETGLCIPEGESCEEPICGNGIIEGVEQCDDRDNANSDGCSIWCTLEVCVQNYTEGELTGGEIYDEEGELVCEEGNTDGSLRWIVIDRSGSMGGTKINDVKAATAGLLDIMIQSTMSGGQLISGSMIGISSFSQHASMDISFTDDFDAVESVVEGLITNGTTNIASGIQLGYQEFMNSASFAPNADKYMIVLSDGQANAPGANAANLAIAAATGLHEAGVKVFSISVGAPQAANTMLNIASSPADFYELQDSSLLADIFAGIYNQEVCGRTGQTANVFCCPLGQEPYDSTGDGMYNACIAECGDGQQYCADAEICIDNGDECPDLSCDITVTPQGGTGGTTFYYTINTDRVNLDNSYIEYGDGMTGEGLTGEHSYDITGYILATGHVEKNGESASCELDTSIRVCGDGQQYCAETGLCIPEGEDCGNLSCTITVAPQGGTGATEFNYTLRNNRVDIDELDSYYIEYGDGSSGTDLIYTYGNTTGDIFATGHVAIAGFDASCELDTSILVCEDDQYYCAETHECLEEGEACGDLSCDITIDPQGGVVGLTDFDYTTIITGGVLTNIAYGDGSGGINLNHIYNSTGALTVTGTIEGENKAYATCTTDVLICGEGSYYCPDTEQCQLDGTDCGDLTCNVSTNYQGGVIGQTEFDYDITSSRGNIPYSIDYGNGSGHTGLNDGWISTGNHIYNSTGTITITGSVTGQDDSFATCTTDVLICGEDEFYCSIINECVEDPSRCCGEGKEYCEETEQCILEGESCGDEPVCEIPFTYEFDGGDNQYVGRDISRQTTLHYNEETNTTGEYIIRYIVYTGNTSIPTDQLFMQYTAENEVGQYSGYLSTGYAGIQYSGAIQTATGLLYSGNFYSGFILQGTGYSSGFSYTHTLTGTANETGLYNVGVGIRQYSGDEQILCEANLFAGEFIVAECGNNITEFGEECDGGDDCNNQCMIQEVEDEEISSGGGGGGASTDYCPDGDYSSSYYDNDCGELEHQSPVGKACRYEDEAYIANGPFTDTLYHRGYPYTEIMRISCMHRGRGIGQGLWIYQPDSNILRSEVLKTIVKILGVAFEDFDIETEDKIYTGATPFADVPADHRFAHYANYALEKGLVSGMAEIREDGQRYLNPSVPANRYEATQVMMIAYDMIKDGEAISVSGASVLGDIVDTNNPYYRYVREAESLGFIEGVPQNDGSYLFEGTRSITRGEFAKIMGVPFGEQLFDLDQVVLASSLYKIIAKAVQDTDSDKFVFINHMINQLQEVDKATFIESYRIQKDLFLEKLGELLVAPLIEQQEMMSNS